MTMELFIIIWAAMGFAAAMVAKGKGRDGVLWFALGLIGGVFALVAVAVMDDSA